jgi:hypothetical protein
VWLSWLVWGSIYLRGWSRLDLPTSFPTWLAAVVSGAHPEGPCHGAVDAVALDDGCLRELHPPQRHPNHGVRLDVIAELKVLLMGAK